MFLLCSFHYDAAQCSSVNNLYDCVAVCTELLHFCTNKVTIACKIIQLLDWLIFLCIIVGTTYSFLILCFDIKSLLQIENDPCKTIPEKCHIKVTYHNSDRISSGRCFHGDG